MKKPAIPLTLIPGSYSQNIDLKVTTIGDLVACCIEGISDNQIYFEVNVIGRKYN